MHTHFLDGVQKRLCWNVFHFITSTGYKLRCLNFWPLLSHNYNNASTYVDLKIILTLQMVAGSNTDASRSLKSQLFQPQQTGTAQTQWHIFAYMEPKRLAPTFTIRLWFSMPLFYSGLCMQRNHVVALHYRYMSYRISSEELGNDVCLLFWFGTLCTDTPQACDPFKLACFPRSLLQPPFPQNILTISPTTHLENSLGDTPTAFWPELGSNKVCWRQHALL